MDSSFGERFWDLVCGYRHGLAFFLVLDAILLVLSLFALALGPSQPGARLVLYLDLAVGGVLLIVVSYLLVRCR